MTIRTKTTHGAGFMCTTCGKQLPPGPAAVAPSEHTCPACPVCGVIETIERGRRHKPSCMIVASPEERQARIAAAIERCAFELSEIGYNVQRIREWMQR